MAACGLTSKRGQSRDQASSLLELLDKVDGAFIFCEEGSHILWCCLWHVQTSKATVKYTKKQVLLITLMLTHMASRGGSVVQYWNFFLHPEKS